VMLVYLGQAHAVVHSPSPLGGVPARA